MKYLLSAIITVLLVFSSFGCDLNKNVNSNISSAKTSNDSDSKNTSSYIWSESNSNVNSSGNNSVSEPLEFTREVYGENEQDKIKSLLSSYPAKTTNEDQQYKYDFVVSIAQLPQGQENWDMFYNKTQRGESAAIIIVQYTIEGDPILIYLSYKDGKYTYVMDISRDKFSGESIKFITGSYKFIKKFDREDAISFVLLNDESITYKKYMTMIADDQFVYEKQFAFLFQISKISQ